MFKFEDKIDKLKFEFEYDSDFRNLILEKIELKIYNLNNNLLLLYPRYRKRISNETNLKETLEWREFYKNITLAIAESDTPFSMDSRISRFDKDFFKDDLIVPTYTRIDTGDYYKEINYIKYIPSKEKPRIIGIIRIIKSKVSGDYLISPIVFTNGNVEYDLDRYLEEDFINSIKGKDNENIDISKLNLIYSMPDIFCDKISTKETNIIIEDKIYGLGIKTLKLVWNYLNYCTSVPDNVFDDIFYHYTISEFISDIVSKVNLDYVFAILAHLESLGVVRIINSQIYPEYLSIYIKHIRYELFSNVLAAIVSIYKSEPNKIYEEIERFIEIVKNEEVNLSCFFNQEEIDWNRLSNDLKEFVKELKETGQVLRFWNFKLIDCLAKINQTKKTKKEYKDLIFEQFHLISIYRLGSP